MLNIDEFDFETPLDVVIINPATGQPTGAVITVYGSNSKKAREIIVNDSRKKLLAIEAQADKTKEEKEKEKKEVTLISDHDYYAEAIVSWVGFGNSDGEIECTPDNIRKYFQDKRISFVVNQLNMKCRTGGYNPKQSNDSRSGSGKKRGTKAQ